MAKLNEVHKQFIVQDAASSSEAALEALKGTWNEEAKALVEETFVQISDLMFEAVFNKRRAKDCPQIDSDGYICCIVDELSKGVFLVTTYTDFRKVNHGK